MRKEHSCTVKFDDIPETVDLSNTIKRFGRHKYHLGAWGINLPKNNLTDQNRLPPVKYTSHIVRQVLLNNDGNLDIDIEIINSPRGFILAKQYDTSKFKMVPVMDEEMINIYRFDFVKEE